MKITGATKREPEFLVLVAEDNEDDALFLRSAFVNAGLGKSVVFVRDGEEVIKYLLQQPPFDDSALCPRPSLLLLDARMPKIDGMDVLLWLSRHPELEPLPVLVCTSSLTPEQRERAVQLGAEGCLQKPFRLDEWESMVGHLKKFASLGKTHPLQPRPSK